MIVTVTPSPAIDWTVTVAGFQLDAVNRASSTSREPSGKGVNVSWALHRGGVPTTAVFPAGGDTGRFMTTSLSRAGIPHHTIETGAEVRTNISLLSPGHATKINEPGPYLDSERLEALATRVVEVAAGARAVLVCGSLPTQTSPGFVGDLVARLRAVGATVVVDTSGEPLRHAIPHGPDLVKPNVHELAELARTDIRTLGQVVDAARTVLDDGAGAVLASLGGDGAMLVDRDHALLASARDIPFVNAVGAGDALLAGFVSHEGPAAARLATAVLWASSAVSHETTLFSVRPEFASRITVDDVHTPDLALTEPSEPLI